MRLMAMDIQYLLSTCIGDSTQIQSMEHSAVCTKKYAHFHCFVWCFLLAIFTHIFEGYFTDGYFTIRDSIRQGGVLSVIEYATLIDEIAKELKKNNIGLKTKQGTTLNTLL